MGRVSTYLNFERETEDAFNFYREVFGTEFIGEIMRMQDGPPQEGRELPPEDQLLIMHIELPILDGHVLMGTDMPKSLGMDLTVGNNVLINLEPDTLAETEELFEALSAGGTVNVPLTNMFWGAVFGSVTDKFGILWMFNGPAE